MLTQTYTLAFWSPGPQEMVVVGIIALLLFGKRLPEVARNLGKGFSEFKKGMQGFQDEVRTSASTSDRIDYSSSDSSSADRPVAEEPETSDFDAPAFQVDNAEAATK